MAGSYNKVILVGNLVRDPEVRYTTAAKAVCKFCIAVNNPRNKEEVTFVDIIAWEKLGEVCNQYLRKGSNVLVDGRLVIRSYETKDGDKRKATEVVIDSMQMLGGGRDVPDEDREYAEVGARKRAEPDGPVFGRPGKAEPQFSYNDELEDEIPFRWRMRCKANIAEGTVTAGCHYRRSTNTRKWVMGI